MYQRILDLKALSKRRSLFLIGPRQTGKSTLLRKMFPKAVFIDLLEADTFRRLSIAPETIRKFIAPDTTQVIIDEVQKLPNLLDEDFLLQHFVVQHIFPNQATCLA